MDKAFYTFYQNRWRTQGITTNVAASIFAVAEDKGLSVEELDKRIMSGEGKAIALRCWQIQKGFRKRF